MSKEGVRFELVSLVLESVIFPTRYTAHSRQRGPGVPGVMSAVGRVLGGQAGVQQRPDAGRSQSHTSAHLRFKPRLVLTPERMCFRWYHMAEDDPELCLVMGRLKIWGFILKKRMCA